MTLETMHPCVLLGSYTWDQSRMPPDEFEMRMSAAYKIMDTHGWKGIFVYGDAVSHQALAYFTNYVPRMRWAFAMLPREGKPRILLSVTPRDVLPMSLMTWIKDVKTGWTWESSFNPWVEKFCENEKEVPRVGLLGKEQMRETFNNNLTDSTNDKVTFDDASAALAPLLSQKRPREVALIQDAWKILERAAHTMAEYWNRDSDCMIAAVEAERTARNLAAHDVRILFSVDGGKTLQPFFDVIRGRYDPMVAYIAVKYLGYWAESYVTVGSEKSASWKIAMRTLDQMIAAAEPGQPVSKFAEIAHESLGERSVHPIVGRSFGHAIGLDINEHPNFTLEEKTPLQSENCYTLRFGISGEDSDAALVSAMIEITETGARLMGRLD